MSPWKYLVGLMLLVVATAKAQAPPPEDHWQVLANLPLGVFNADGTVVDDKLVITGGLTQLGLAGNAVQVMDLTEGTWQIHSILPVGRCNHVQLPLPDRAVMIAAGQATPAPVKFTRLDDAYRIDLATMRVTPLPNLPKPMAEPTGHVLPNGCLMVIGNDIAVIFDPQTATWARPVALHHPRRAHASAMLDDGRVVIVGGLGQDSIELIAPPYRHSQLLASHLPWQLDDLTATALDDQRLWIAGGQRSDTGDTLDKTWFLRLPPNGRSELQPGPALQLAHGVADHRAVRLGPNVYLFGGESQKNQRDVELHWAAGLDIATLRLTALPTMNWPHDDALAFVHDGAVLVVGGYAGPRVEVGSTEAVIPMAIPVVERWKPTKR